MERDMFITVAICMARYVYYCRNVYGTGYLLLARIGRMANHNYLPRRFADCRCLLIRCYPCLVVGVGIMQNGKIYNYTKWNCKMNMRNCRYSAKWRNGGGSDWCSMVDGNVSISSTFTTGQCREETFKQFSLERGSLIPTQNLASRAYHHLFITHWHMGS